jgi:hypothetical protein
MIILGSSKLNGQPKCHAEKVWWQWVVLFTLWSARFYFLIEKMEKIVGCKWDTLTKHQGCKIAMWGPHLEVKKGGGYIVKNCAHLKNMRLYHQHVSRSILKQLHCPMGGAHWKMVQMKTLFHTFYTWLSNVGIQVFVWLVCESASPKKSNHALVWWSWSDP